MNTNDKFTGFTPEELAEEAQTPKEEPIDPLIIAESDNVPCDGTPHGHHWENGVAVCDSKSPENGQSILKNLPSLQTIYYNKEAIENLKAKILPTSSGKQIQFFHYDTLKKDDLAAEQNPPLNATISQYEDFVSSGDFLSVEDIKKAKESLIAASQKVQQAQINAKIDAANMAANPITVTTPYTTYILGKDAYFGYDTPQLEMHQKEIGWLKAQLEEAVEIIKQESGEPTEFIYIHPFDLYELLNSFVISPVLSISEELSDKGYIEIGGKKYKQSTMMPIKSKTWVVDSSKYLDQYSNCDVCNGTSTGHTCDKHLPNPNEIP